MIVELYRPAVSDLWFKRDLLADEITMSYNRAWGGTVDFPEDLWGHWHDAWVASEGEGRRYHRYLRDSGTGEFVGEVAYRWDPGYDSFITDVLVHARFRGRGYGGVGLLAGYSTASPSERAHVNTMRLCRIMRAEVLVCAAYAVAVALLVYAHVLGALDRTALFLVAGIGAIVPVAALCVAGYRVNMSTYA